MEKLLSLTSTWLETDTSLYIRIPVIAAAILVLSRVYLNSQPGPIRNARREEIPYSEEDTRFTRFSHGKELGDRLLKELGHIYTFKSGNNRELVLTTAEDVKAYYKDATDRDESKAHMKALVQGFGDYIGQIMGSCVGFKYGDDWKRIRDSVDPYFTHKIAVQSLSLMFTLYNDWIGSLDKSPSATPLSETNAFDIDAVAAIKQMPFKVITKVTYGELLTDERFEELWALHPLHDKIMATAIHDKLAGRWFHPYLPTQANRDLREFKSRFRQFNDDIVQDTIKSGYETIAVSMWSALQQGCITPEEYYQTLDEILFANIDVTSVAQAWMLTDIAKHTSIQDDLHAEINEVLSSSSDDQDIIEKYISRTDTHLHRVYLESARLHPVLWYNLPEVISVPKVLQGYHIPAGTSVCISTYHLNTNPSTWGPDSETFRPSRFTTLKPADYRYSFWRFGLGPRQCLGKHFATLIVKLAAFEAVRLYRMELVGDVEATFQAFSVAPKAMLRFRRKE